MSVLDPNDAAHARAEERLRAEPIVWLTTVSAGGQPQSTPVWFSWDGRSFLVFSRPARPKLANISGNPRVSLHLEGDRSGGDNVIFEGAAEVAPDAPPADQVPDYLGKYRPLIDEYGWTPESFAADYSVAVRITPTRARVW